MFSPTTTEEFNKWRRDHPEGFLVNHYANPTLGHLVLHRANCPCFKTDQEYVGGCAKTCAERIGDLRIWASRVVGAINLQECGLCRPS